MQDILWVDLETTGLEPDATVLEVAALLTDKEGNIRYQVEEVFEFDWSTHTMSDRVLEMHTKSDLRNATATMHKFSDVDDKIACMLPAGTYLGGSSVQFDRHFIERDLPLVSERLIYRNIDSTTLKKTAESAGVKLDVPRDSKHRALDDIKVSLSIYRQVRSLLKGV
jgi:oligoribonuclease (3'-5' exoribonuclease)